VAVPGPIGPFPPRVEGEAAQVDYDKMRRRLLWSLPYGLYVVGSGAGDSVPPSRSPGQSVDRPRSSKTCTRTPRVVRSCTQNPARCSPMWMTSRFLADGSAPPRNWSPACTRWDYPNEPNWPIGRRPQTPGRLHPAAHQVTSLVPPQGGGCSASCWRPFCWPGPPQQVARDAGAQRGRPDHHLHLMDWEVSRRSTRRVRAGRVGSCSMSRCGSSSRGDGRATGGRRRSVG
jgi:hypothetical protein